jgi:hypothetical protein
MAVDKLGLLRKGLFLILADATRKSSKFFPTAGR